VQGCLSKHNTSQLPCCQQRLIRELLELFNSVCFVRRDELDAREEQCAAVTLALGSFVPEHCALLPSTPSRICGVMHQNVRIA
jgi:hypothetical protein